MNLNAIIPSVYISSISYCMKIPTVSLLSNEIETFHAKDLVLITKLTDTS